MGSLSDWCLIVAAFAAWGIWAQLDDLRCQLHDARQYASQRHHWFDTYTALAREVEALEEDARRRDDALWQNVRKRLRSKPSSVWLRIEAESEWEIADQLTRMTVAKP